VSADVPLAEVLFDLLALGVGERAVVDDHRGDVPPVPSSETAYRTVSVSLVRWRLQTMLRPRLT
jgi:hypothetical protein